MATESWADTFTIANETPDPDPIESDQGYITLLSMVPPDRQEQAKPFLGMILSQIKSQLGENYPVFVNDVRTGYEYFASGDIENADATVGKYGFSFSTLQAMM